MNSYILLLILSVPGSISIAPPIEFSSKQACQDAQQPIHLGIIRTKSSPTPYIIVSECVKK